MTLLPLAPTLGWLFSHWPLHWDDPSPIGPYAGMTLLPLAPTLGWLLSSTPELIHKTWRELCHFIGPKFLKEINMEKWTQHPSEGCCGTDIFLWNCSLTVLPATPVIKSAAVLQIHHISLSLSRTLSLSRSQAEFQTSNEKLYFSQPQFISARQNACWQLWPC